jgi:N-acetylneuraminic acid mutarotase
MKVVRSLSIVFSLALFLFVFASSTFAATLTWTTKSSMPTARQTPAVVATNNGKVYAIGGYNENPLTSVEEYDIATDTWTTKTSMPTARHNLAAATGTNGKIYVFGGYNGSDPVATVEEYDPTTDTWATKSDMPTARHALAVATASNGKIYAVGGTPGTVSTVEEYDPTTDTWVTKADMPTGRYALTLVAGNNGKLYAIGGHTATDPNIEDIVEEYDLTTDTWVTKADMPTRRTGVAGVAGNNGYIYVLGGYREGYNRLDTVERYDPAANMWTTDTSMPTPHYLLGAAVGSNGKIYAVGGYDGINLATVEEATINQPPQLPGLSEQTISEGELYTEEVSFDDPDSTSWTGTIDYGDGSGVEPIEVFEQGTYFMPYHIYTQAGVYTVTATITDNQGASGIFNATITVENTDPVTVTFDASEDTYVRSGQGNRNFGSGIFMRVQPSGDNRALVKFDQNAMQSTISGTVLEAKLRLTITDNNNSWGATGRTVDVHRLISDWTEGTGTENNNGTGSGATWNCAIDSIISNAAKNCSGTTEWEMGQPNNPSVHPWVQTATDSETITNNQTGVVEYDVTSDVTAFMNGTNNYGWIVRKTNEGQNGQVSFGTRESASQPQLVVTYQP